MWGARPRARLDRGNRAGLHAQQKHRNPTHVTRHALRHRRFIHVRGRAALKGRVRASDRRKGFSPGRRSWSAGSLVIPTEGRNLLPAGSARSLCTRTRPAQPEARAATKPTRAPKPAASPPSLYPFECPAKFSAVEVVTISPSDSAFSSHDILSEQLAMAPISARRFVYRRASIYYIDSHQYTKPSYPSRPGRNLLRSPRVSAGFRSASCCDLHGYDWVDRALRSRRTHQRQNWKPASR